MKIILFGSSGMLGTYVFNNLKENYDVVCINRDEFNIEENDWGKLYKIITNIVNSGDIIVNCAGIIPQKNNLDLRKFICVNTLFPHKLDEISKLLNLKLIHITTDCVYNGLKGDYNIDDKHDSQTFYGISKSLGEPIDSTVIRTSIIGEEINGKKSLLEWIKSNKDCEIKGYQNHLWNGVTCLTLANIITTIIDEKLFWKGIKHICSPNIVSKYDLCCYINEIYNLNITIHKIHDEETKNMTLIETPLNYNFKIKNIYEQINDLFNYKFKNIFSN